MEAMLEEITLKVDGMTCGGCVNGVEKAVSRVRGVTEVKVDLKAGTARVRGTALDAETLVAVVYDAGYEARVE
ncbi:MAG: heavy metal-associated domain-containing protein [Myxococcota bacterium]